MSEPSWPVSIVTGMLGSGKTTLIRRLLQDPSASNTLVLVNEFGEIGLDHRLLREVTDDVVLLPNGCLCCTVRNDLIQTLTSIRRDWLSGRVGHFDRVLIETSGLAEPAPLVASLATHPVLSDAFMLQAVSTIVDGEHGVDQMERFATGRNQVRVADHLFVSKLDLVDRVALKRLARQVRTINRLARLRSVDGATLAGLFQRTVAMPTASRFVCEETISHLDSVSTVTLRPTGILCWSDFRAWLGTLLEESGDSLLRLKGSLPFDVARNPLLLQAVHHAFYPLVEAPGETGGPTAGWLVLIFDGAVPPSLAAGASTAGLRT